MKLPDIRHTRAARLGVLATSVVLIAALGPSAALAGKTGGGSGGPQFPPDPGLVCGADIDHSLQMTKNYDCGNGFRIIASGITIDLAGYTVRVTNGGQQAFRIEGTKVTIKNGTIVTDRRDYNSRGVQLGPDKDVTLSRLTFAVASGNYGVVCDEGVGSVSMANVTITGGQNGFYGYNCRLSVTSSTVSSATGEGIYDRRDNMSVAISASLSGVDVHGNGGDGIHIERMPTTITNSTIYLNNGEGVEHNGNGESTLRLSGNQITDNSGWGAFADHSYTETQGAYIASNVFLRNREALLIRNPGFANTTTVKGNEARDNTYQGFYADQVYYPQVSSGNTARNNGFNGFYADGTFSSSSTDRCYGNGTNYSGGWTCTVLSK